MPRRPAALLAGIFLPACGLIASKADPPAASAASAPVAGPAAASRPAEPPKMAALPFRLDVTFSAAAAERLQRLGERVTVDAYYYGEPKPGFAPKTPEEVSIMLGTEQAEIEPRNRSVTLRARFDASQLTREVAGEPKVLVNVYSARRSGPDNLLSCGVVDEPLPLLAETGASLHCKLISE